MIGSVVSSLSISVLFGAMLAGGSPAQAAPVARQSPAVAAVGHAAMVGGAGLAAGAVVLSRVG